MALVDDLVVEAAREVERVLERPPRPALGHQLLHGRLADVLDGPQRVADGALPIRLAGCRRHREGGAGSVDIGRQQGDAEALQLLTEDVQLVRVVEVQGHGRGEELYRVVGLQVCRLVGDKGIGGGVRLVEAIAGELGHLLEYQRGLGLGHGTRHRAIDEHLALLVHFLLDLLAHGAAQDVGRAQGVAGEFLGDLHDLLLVDHDAEGLLEDALQGRVQVVGGLFVVLAADVARDVVHGPRPIERHHGDDVLEGVGLELAQGIAHAGAFQLEDARRLATPDHFIGRPVVERQPGQVEGNAAIFEQFDCMGEHGERLQAQEVELHEPRLLDVLHAETGDPHPRARVAIEGDELVEGTVADDDAGGVGGGVAVKALEPPRDLDQASDRGVRLDHFLEPRVAGDRLVQGHRVGRVVGDHLADTVDLRVGHLQDPPHVPEHGARLQLAKGDDLGDPLGAVLLLDVADDLVAAVLAEVDVEVGHRDALGVEEALEKEPEAQRIEIGDGQGPGDHRAGPRTASRADRYALGLGPADEVGDDQEVAVIAHAGDDAEFVFEALVVLTRLCRALVGRHVGGRDLVLQARLQPGHGEGAQGLLLGASVTAVIGRQDGIARLHHEGAAARHDHGVVHGIGKVGEQDAHLGGRFEAVLGGQTPALRLRYVGPLGDADEGVVGLVHFGVREKRLVGGQQGEIVVVGEADEIGFDSCLGFQSVALQLDVEPARKSRRQARQQIFRRRALPVGQQPSDRSLRAAAERDETVGVLGQGVHGHPRLLGALGFEVGLAQELQEVAVAGLVLHQKDEAVGSRRLGGGGHGPLSARAFNGDAELAADDGLHAGGGAGGGELQRPEQVVGVGDGDRRHGGVAAQRHQLVDAQGALQEGIGGVHAKMDEIGVGHGR